MAPITVPAIYDGEHVQLLAHPPVQGAYRVVVTFIAPTQPGEATASPAPDLLATFGTWQDSRPLEETLRDIHEARRSKVAPPGL